MPVGARRTSSRAVLVNEDGQWHVWLRLMRNPQTGAIVGPGHIGRVIAADGTTIVDDYLTADVNLNDSRNGGLGSFGCHLARQNEHFPADPNNYMWNFTSRMDAATIGGYGICRVRVLVPPQVDANGIGRLTVESALSDGASYPSFLFLVRHTYAVYPRRVEQQIDVAAAWDGSGPAVFVKEPKLTCHSIGPPGGPRYRYLSVYAAEGDTLLDEFDIWSLPNPDKHTQQLPYRRRCRLQFLDEANAYPFTAVVMGYAPDNQRLAWQDGPGLDQWARDANTRERLHPDCKPYCLQGPLDEQGNRTLSRKWELGRFASDRAGSEPDPTRPQVGVGLHAWEGGTGAYDCPCASRSIPPYGTTYRTWACYSLSDGWTT